eukprot:4512108-Amphidinium_carterae.1
MSQGYNNRRLHISGLLDAGIAMLRVLVELWINQLTVTQSAELFDVQDRLSGRRHDGQQSIFNLQQLLLRTQAQLLILVQEELEPKLLTLYPN